MPDFDDEWSRSDAERKAAALFDAAKTGHAQKIIDVDGTFELTFRKASIGPTVAEFLLKQKPIEGDED